MEGKAFSNDEARVVPHPAAIVLGCGEVGSAVAFALHQAGLAVVLADEADPSCHRRGMAFTNAGMSATRNSRAKGRASARRSSIPSILARRMIAATTWSWPGVAASGTDVARGRMRAQTPPSDAARPRSRHHRHRLGVCQRRKRGCSDRRSCRNSQRMRRAPTGGAHLADTGRPAVRSTSTVAVSVRHGRFMTERRIGDRARWPDCRWAG